MKNPVFTFFLGMFACALIIGVASDNGIIRQAHAMTINAAVRVMQDSILKSEERIMDEIGKACADPEAEG